MNQEQIALARRAVARKGFRWLDGMRVLRPDGSLPMRRVGENAYVHEGSVSDFKMESATGTMRDDLPDLDDPATLGCLLALVREAWKDPEIYCAKAWMAGWAAYSVSYNDQNLTNDDTFDSEPEALVSALENAP